MSDINDRSNLVEITESNARGLVCGYFKDWRPSYDFIVKLVQFLPKEKLELLINDKDLKTIKGLNKDEKYVIS